LIAANHISWLDIHVIASQLPVTFVAKADVMAWPVFGRLASAVNTIYLNRNKASDIKRVLKEMAARFQSEERVCIFPEGTSSDGSSILPFKSNLFQAAVESSVPVLPLLFQYRFQGEHTNAPGYYGDITLMESFMSLFKRPHIEAQITVLDPVVDCATRQEYCEQSREKLMIALENSGKNVAP
jgi:1-acyl-sn-glycerol-3-phosphate acyltransferase